MDQGFTLVELMITLAVAGILIAAAAPSFTAVINSNRLATLSNDMIASLQTARMESLRRGVPVIVCRSENGSSCSTGAQWGGWIVFADANRDNAPATAEILRYEKVREPLQLWSSPAVSGNSSRIKFRPDGFAYDNANALLAANMAACIPQRQSDGNARDIGVTAGSRFEVDKRNGNGSCAAPANP